MLLWPFITQTSPMTMLSISIVSSPEVTVSFWPVALASLGGEGHLPAARLAVGRRLGLLLAELHGHLAAGLGPAPDRDRLVALDDHVARKDAMRLERAGGGIARAQRDGQQDRQRKDGRLAAHESPSFGSDSW